MQAVFYAMINFAMINFEINKNKLFALIWTFIPDD